MSDYNRTTRECSVSQLHPDLLRAIRSYFEESNLGVLETETQICCETVSEKKELGSLAFWLKGTLDTTVHTGMILTSEWLIWARKGDQSEIVLNAANLKEIQVRPFASLLVRDTGLEVSGFIGNSKGQVRGYIGMGPELAAQKFCEEVQKAILVVNPPIKRKLPKWLGG